MTHDAVVVGAGPNGLAAAIELARAGLSVLVREARSEVGGGASSMALTLPGFVHDPFSGIHPLAVGSPFLSSLPLGEHGLTWIHPPAPLAHAMDDGSSIVVERSIDLTADVLGVAGRSYRSLIEPFSRQWWKLARDILGPPRVPRTPILLGRFGLRALRSARSTALERLGGGRAGALFAGSAAHSGLPLDSIATSAFGIVLHAAAHAVGWPFPAGGAGRIGSALRSYFESIGGTVETEAPVESLDDLPPARAIVLDLTPRQVLALAGDLLPVRYARQLRRFRYGAGVFKLDWALAAPIPWRAVECARAGTVHLGGSFREVALAMDQVSRGQHPRRPFILLAQHSRFDSLRAPPGMHTAWAYCHVPNGSTRDMTAQIEHQIERFAPGFRDLILARSILPPRALQSLDANLVGGDVNGGAPTAGQILFRPTRSLDPYSTPVDGLFICSASTPPGGGVHGMCGYHAARSVLRYLEHDPERGVRRR